MHHQRVKRRIEMAVGSCVSMLLLAPLPLGGQGEPAEQEAGGSWGRDSSESSGISELTAFPLRKGSLLLMTFYLCTCYSHLVNQCTKRLWSTDYVWGAQL